MPWDSRKMPLPHGLAEESLETLAVTSKGS